MPSRETKQVPAQAWVYSTTVEHGKEHRAVAMAMGAMQIACQSSDRRSVSARTADSITVYSSKPQKYDAARAWFERTVGEEAAKSWRCDLAAAPTVAMCGDEVPTSADVASSAAPAGFLAAEDSALARTDVLSACPSVLAAPADTAKWPPHPRVVMFRCLLVSTELKPDPTEDYDTSGNQKLGEGTFGKVLAGIHKNTGEPVALKCFKSSDTMRARRNMLEEAMILREVAGSNHVVPLLDICYVDGCFALVFPRRICLHKLLTKGCPMANIEIAIVCGHLMAGLAHVHGCQIFHADIKPNNLLVKVISSDFCFPSQKPGSAVLAGPADTNDALADAGRARWLQQLETDVLIQICDLGAAMCLPADPQRSSCKHSHIQTLYYRAPEILLEDPAYGYAADMWSAGCVLAEFGLGEPLFQGSSKSQQLRLICQCKGTVAVSQKLKWLSHPANMPVYQEGGLPTKLLKGMSAEGLQCLAGCTELDPAQRWTAREAGESLFLNFRNLHLFSSPSGCSSWKGGRGDFCLQSGLLEEDVLEYLRRDPWWSSESGAATFLHSSQKKVSCT